MKWQEVSKILTVAGSISVVGLFSYLFLLTGMEYTHSGDSECFYVDGIHQCDAYINITTRYWNFEFEHLDDDSYIYLPQDLKSFEGTLTRYKVSDLNFIPTLYKKSTRGRKLWVNLDMVDDIIDTQPNVKVDWLVPARGKDNWRPIKDGDTWDRLKNNRIKLVGYPTNTHEDIKWSFIVGEVDIDPIWDVSTAEFVHSFSVADNETNPSGVSFNDDGTKMYVVGYTNDNVNEYDLSTAWDVSSASYLQLFSVHSQENSPLGLYFKPDGTKMYIVGAGGGAEVNEYDLSDAWNVTSAGFVQALSVSSKETSSQGLFFKSDGTKMYIIGYLSDNVNEYNLSSAWDISSALFFQLFSISSETLASTDLYFKPDGTKMYITGFDPDSVFEYDLSDAWNVTSTSYLQSYGVGSQEANTYGLFFKSDGTKMYIVGTTGDDVNEYNIPDTLGPTFSDDSINSTISGTEILHSLKCTDDLELTTTGGYIFSFDNGTGSFTNDSWVAFSSNPDWSNVTKSINITFSTTIQWKVYANDTSDNWNTSDTYSYVTTDVTPPLISFVDPTPTNNTNIVYDYTFINVSISDVSTPDDITSFIDWNYSLGGWWRFDNSTDFLDHSSYSNDGINHGSTYTTDGKFGGARTFDGADDYIDCGNTSSIQPTAAITVETWINPTQNQEHCYDGSEGNYGIAGSVNGANSTSTWSWQLRYGSADACSLGFQLNTVAGSKWVTVGYNLTESVWTHIVITFNGTHEKLYVNSVLTDTESFASTTINVNKNNKILLGVAGWGVSNTYYNGSIDEFRIYDRVLSLEEIQASYNTGLYDLYCSFTDLDEDTYTYIAYAQDSSGNVNQTETRSFIVGAVDFDITESTGTLFRFYAYQPIQTEIEPYGQTSTKGMFTVENNLSYVMDIYAKLDETTTGVTLKLNDEYSYSDSISITTDYKLIYTDLAVSDTGYIWAWADFDNLLVQWEPELYIVGGGS